ncbi:MAG: hypothetical protein R6X22_03025 [Gemmatimonadota bacterium]
MRIWSRARWKPSAAATGGAGRARPRSRREEGYILPAALLSLTVLSLLAIAAFESARLEGLAARSLAASIRAFYAADGGLASLLAGAPEGVDSTGLAGVRLALRREVLLSLPDGGALVRLVADASADGAAGRDRARRVLALAVVVGPDGVVLRRPGAWTEITRPGAG